MIKETYNDQSSMNDIILFFSLPVNYNKDIPWSA